MPAAWVLRDGTPDYGLDGEVEIFEDETATAQLFKFQLKGSDHVVPNAPSVRIESETFIYWRNLDLPVLLVLVDVKSETVYGRWVHAIDELRSRDPAPKKFTVNFGQGHILTRDSFKQMQFDVAVFSGLRRKELSWPLPVKLAVAEDWNGPSEITLRAQLARNLQGSQVGTMMSGDEGTPSILVSLSKTQLGVSLPLNYASVTRDLTHAIGTPLTEAVVLAADICVMLGANLSSAGFHSQATLISAPALTKSSTICESTLLVRLVDSYIKSGLVDQLIQLATTVFNCDGEDMHLVGVIITAEILDRLPSGPSSGATALATQLQEHARTLEEVGDVASAGVIHHNLGVLYVKTKEFDRAILAYSEAERLRPDYALECFFHESRAGALWREERFQESADAYQLSIDTGGEDQELLPLLADALLSAGKYEEARGLLSDWEPSSSKRRILGMIVQRIATFLVQEVGLTDQSRIPLNLDDLSAIESISSPESVFAAIRDIDALDPRLWIQLINAAAVRDDLGARILVAHVSWWIESGWAAAAYKCFLAGEQVWSEALIEQGLRHCGDNFLDVVDGRSLGDGEEYKGFKELVHTMYVAESSKLPADPLRLIEKRLLGEGGEEVLAKHDIGIPLAEPDMFK
jgi:tetratricopeptide (TPR) repeat protein